MAMLLIIPIIGLLLELAALALTVLDYLSIVDADHSASTLAQLGLFCRFLGGLIVLAVQYWTIIMKSLM